MDFDHFRLDTSQDQSNWIKPVGEMKEGFGEEFSKLLVKAKEYKTICPRTRKLISVIQGKYSEASDFFKSVEDGKTHSRCIFNNRIHIYKHYESINKIVIN